LQSEPGVTEPALAGDQLVSRFIYEESKISRKSGKPQLGAFLPMFEAAFNRYETSMCHINACANDARIWQCGIEARDRPLVARVDLQVSIVQMAQLRCLASPNPPSFNEHAVVVDWPEDKEGQKKLALEIAKACPTVKRTPQHH
jgi:hypothetical protein